MSQGLVKTRSVIASLVLRPIRYIALLPKFHPGKETLEWALRHRCAGMFTRALSVRLVEKNVRSAA